MNRPEKTVLLICDVWDRHWCSDMLRRVTSLADRINGFAQVVRKHGGRVLHCPSDTVDRYYDLWPQRVAMKEYPEPPTRRRRKRQIKPIRVSQEMRLVTTPLDTTSTNGCPDVPLCHTCCKHTKQHEGVEICSRDLISDSGQEVYNFIIREGIECVLIAGVALNMCVLGRPFGVISLVDLGVTVRVVSDLVDVAYSPSEAPYVTVEQARWFMLGYIQSKWCPVTSCYEESRYLPKETSMKIHSNFPGSVLSNLRRQYELDFFVETGTAQGDTTELAANVFDWVWSCDVDLRMIGRARERLKGYYGVEFSTESSPDFLRRIEPELTHPAVYWLDAHWCGGPVKPVKECPLLEEIEAIGTFFNALRTKERGEQPQVKRARVTENLGPSVLLIDDINLVESPPPPPHDPSQWPTMDELRSALDEWGEPYRFETYQGTHSKVLIVTPE